MTGAREALVLLHEGAGTAGRDAVARHGRVLQAAGERLLVVDAAGTPLDALRQLPGVARVVTDPADAATLGGLADGDALFAQAWAARLTAPPKQRRGEGLDWDATGFEAP